MGRRVVVMKKREVEYGDVEAFNYGIYDLASVLDEMCVSSVLLDDGYGYNVELEVNAKSLKEEIEQLKSENERVKNGGDITEFGDGVDFSFANVKKLIEDSLEYSVEKFIEVMEAYMKEGDHRNEYYYFTQL